MAPLPVINDVFRVTLNWSQHEGVTPRNVLHFLSNTGDEADLAAALDAQMLNDMWVPMSINQTIDSYAIIKLDGTSATQVIASTAGTHGRADNAIIPQVAAIASLRTSQRGSRGRGRVYIGPCCEDKVGSGIITAVGDVAGMQTAWSTFTGGMVTEGAGYEFGVASYVHADFNGLNNLTIERTLATQRRRQDQLR